MGTRTIRIARVSKGDEIGSALDSIGLDRGRPTIVVVGGAGGLGPEEISRLAPLFERAIAPAAEQLRANVVDGGTDCGVMQLMGKSRAAIGGTFPLVGVCAENTVVLPGIDAPEDAANVEPRHTHLIVVPGNAWGDEAPWLARVAHVLSGGQASVTVLVNGGEVALADVEHSVAASRPVLVVEDTGRIADDLHTAIKGGPGDERVRALAGSELVVTVDAVNDTDALVRALQSALTSGSEG